MDIAKYLKPYSEHQIKNWKGSKKIVVYSDEAQLHEFVKAARENRINGKKLYFGIILDSVAERVKKEHNIDIKEHNCTIRADEVKKIFKSHGDELTESRRGQRAIIEGDFEMIPEIIGSPEVVENAGIYNNSPVLRFKKAGQTLAAVVSRKHLDIYTQTMYVAIKNRSLATPIDEQAPIDTPETTSGTASDNRSLATATDEQAPVNTPETTRSTASNNIISEMKQNTTEI